MLLTLVSALIAVASLAQARTAPGAKPPRGKRIYDTKFLDINRWHLPFYNDGRFAIDITQQNFPGGYWPAPIRNFYLFGGGLWVGAIFENPGAKSDTFVTVGYNPNSGGGEFYPTLAEYSDKGTGNSADRVYKYGTTDWPPPGSYFASAGGRDTLMVPRDNFSLQDMWMAFSDAYTPQHTSPGRPLGLDVFLTIYAWNYPANQDIFFCIYRVRNSTARIPDGPGAQTLRRVYFGVCNDNDIGDATDDMVGIIKDRYFGADRVENVGFVGDNTTPKWFTTSGRAGRPGSAR
jgi:hypothetical protein